MRLPVVHRTILWRLLGCLVVAAVVAWLSFSHSMAMISRNRAPDRALMFVHNEPLALAARADRLLTKPELDSKSLSTARALALQSLHRQAVNTRALRVLGLIADREKDDQRALALMELAQRLSRREVGVQLWLVQRAAKDGNLPNAIQAFDRALRTSINARPMLFPILLEAIRAPEIREAVAPYIKDGNLWSYDFVNYAIDNSKDLLPIADVIRRAGGLPPGRDEDAAIATLGAKLVEANQVNNLFAIMGRDAQVLRAQTDASLNYTLDSRFAPLGWGLLSQTSVGASAIREGDRTVMLATVLAGRHGVAARKPLMLKSGSYTLTVGYGDIRLGSQATLNWQLVCTAGDGTFHIAWNSGQYRPASQSRSAWTIKVLETCRAQLLDLQLSGGDSQGESEVFIQDVSLRRFN